MKKTVIRYSEAFKLQVVEEVERGEHRSLQEVEQKYGIRGHGNCCAISAGTWCKRGSG